MSPAAQFFATALDGARARGRDFDLQPLTDEELRELTVLRKLGFSAEHAVYGLVGELIPMGGLLDAIEQLQGEGRR
jgi:hypothetical protein